MAAPLLVPLSSVTNNKFQVHFNTTEGNTENGKMYQLLNPKIYVFV